MVELFIYLLIYLLSLPEREQGTQRAGGSITRNCCHM
jgi:hypothetical protein